MSVALSSPVYGGGGGEAVGRGDDAADMLRTSTIAPAPYVRLRGGVTTCLVTLSGRLITLGLTAKPVPPGVYGRTLCRIALQPIPQ